MIHSLAIFLVLAGLVLLVLALKPVFRLIRTIPNGPVRRKWYLVIVLIGGFILGYIAFVIVSWEHMLDWADLVVPVVFFFGAVFVWIIAGLSLQTASDVRRVVMLERESITDPLMGIFNRRYLDRRVEEEFNQAKRYGLPLSVLLLDIDNFKRVNDVFGHQVGDQVLNDLGKLVLNTLRESDILARFGGEEMMVVAPNTHLYAAQALAERLRQHVESHELQVCCEPGSTQGIRITVSIGVASFEPGIQDCQALVRNADAALYRAKQDGRNQVAVQPVGRPAD